MRGCEDEKMFYRPPQLEDIGRTLRPDALGKINQLLQGCENVE